MCLHLKNQKDSFKLSARFTDNENSFYTAKITKSEKAL